MPSTILRNLITRPVISSAVIGEIYSHSFCQVSWKVDVNAVHDREMITQQLQRDHIQEALKCIDGTWDLHLWQVFRKIRVTFITIISIDVIDTYQIRIGLPLRAVTCSSAE
jgi:hypothetical protein